MPGSSGPARFPKFTNALPLIYLIPLALLVQRVPQLAVCTIYNKQHNRSLNTKRLVFNVVSTAHTVVAGCKCTVALGVSRAAGRSASASSGCSLHSTVRAATGASGTCAVSNQCLHARAVCSHSGQSRSCTDCTTAQGGTLVCVPGSSSAAWHT